MSFDEKKTREKYRKLTKLLIEKKLTITTMESATSGQIASLITDTEGASAIFKGAFVTYCNEAKILQGVPKEVIDEYTVYSKETATAMARACAKAYDANISIGVTGTMGNIDLSNAEASVPGQVYFAICFMDETYTYQINIPIQESRFAYKMVVADMIVDKILSIINS